MRKHIKKLAFWLFIIVIVWCGILGSIVWHYGAQDRARKSDCIIVLGAAVEGAVASPVFEERLHHGIRLYHAGQAPRFIFTGGVGDGQRYSESAVGRAFALQNGVPETAIFIEETSRTTQQNLFEARAIMQRSGLTSAIIVSDPLHMKRAMMMADRLEITAVPSPTPTSRYRSFQTKLGFLLRELYFIHHFAVTGH